MSHLPNPYRPDPRLSPRAARVRATMQVQSRAAVVARQRLARPVLAYRHSENPDRPLGARSAYALAGIALSLAAAVLWLTPVAPGTPGIGLLRYGLTVGVTLAGVASLLRAYWMR